MRTCLTGTEEVLQSRHPHNAPHTAAEGFAICNPQSIPEVTQ